MPPCRRPRPRHALHRLAPLALAAAALAAPCAQAHAALRLVATVPDLAAIARDVGGDRVSVTALALPTQDPHFVDARPSLVLDLSRADLLLLVGLDLEVGWLPPLVTGARNARIQPGARGHFDASRHVQLLEVPSAPIERSQGDVHPGGNPHYLYDPRAATAVARALAERLAELDPDGAASYAARAARFAAAADALTRRFTTRLGARRGVPIVAYHRTWAYFADWLGLVPVEFMEPKPGIPPTPVHIAQVLSNARKRGVRLVLQETFYPSHASAVVAGKLGVPLLELPGGTDFRGGEGYLAHVESVATRVCDALGEGPAVAPPAVASPPAAPAAPPPPKADASAPPATAVPR